jgi:hypothetical protein
VILFFYILALRFILQRNVRIADWIYCNSTAEDDIGDTEESFRGYLKEQIETKRIGSCMYFIYFYFELFNYLSFKAHTKQVNN